MKTNNLLASVALFSELYNSSNYENVTDILAEFIKSLVVSESAWSTTPEQMVGLLRSKFGFEIPKSVVKSTLKNRLKKVCSNVGGSFHFDNGQLGDVGRIQAEYKELSENHNRTIDDLCEFINFNQGGDLSKEQRADIENDFQKFLMDSGTQSKYTEKISAFIIKNSKKDGFTINLNLIREGVVLYQGIKYSADLNVSGSWNTDLIIFLSPEHLLNALEYNGTVFRELFDDFHKLVVEVNRSNQTRGVDKRISLRYFPETRDEIDALFTKAERIVSGQAQMTDRRTALMEIVKNCKAQSDVVSKRVQFYQDLRTMGISPQEAKAGDIYKYTDYNVEDSSVLEKIKQESKSKNAEFDEEEAYKLLRLFTRVNYYRGGISKDKFENIGSIYITNKSLALYLARHNAVKFDTDDIPFARDLDYITNSLWFKLRKGLGGAADEFPRSLDVVTKAQIVLSSHVHNSVMERYETLKQELRDHKITEESAQQINYDLRIRLVRPEEITPQTVDDSLAFLESDNYLQEVIEEKLRKDQLLASSQDYIKELEQQIEATKKKDRLTEEKQREAERETAMQEFCTNAWRDERNGRYRSFFYLASIYLLTVFTIVFGILVKGWKVITESPSQWSFSTRAFLCIFVITLSVEVMGRSYIFNKEKTKSGWQWLTFLFRREKFHHYKDDRLAEYEADFKAANPLPKE